MRNQEKYAFDKASKPEQALVALLLYIAEHERPSLSRLVYAKQFNDAIVAVANILLCVPESQRQMLARPQITMDEADQYVHAALQEMVVAAEEAAELREKLERSEEMVEELRGRIERISHIFSLPPGY